MRVNVWLPDELAHTVRDQLPDLNVSAVVQEALRGLLGCHHDQLACAACAAPVSRAELADEALSGLYRALMDALEPAVDRGGTAEGAARIARDVARRWQVTAAEHRPLPRPSRAMRRTSNEGRHIA